MRCLIDTHALIWYVDKDRLLSPIAHATITDPMNDLLLGAGTLRLWMTKAIADLSLAVLPVTLDYADHQTGLPLHHRDPFDRLLVAQSLVESIPIISANAHLDPYGIIRIW